MNPYRYTAPFTASSHVDGAVHQEGTHGMTVHDIISGLLAAVDGLPSPLDLVSPVDERRAIAASVLHGSSRDEARAAILGLTEASAAITRADRALTEGIDHLGTYTANL